MGWFSDLVDAVVDAVETVADVVEDVVNAVADAVADVVESIGNALKDGLNAIGGFLGGIPLIGGFLEGAFAWLGGIVAGITNLVGAIIKGVLGIVGGVIGGLIKIIGGILTLNGDLIKDGLIDFGASILGAALSILGTLAALVQRVIFCQNNERKLTKEEMAILRIVFQNSLSLYDIRLIEGWSGIFGITTHGAFTLNNTIYLNKTDLTTNPETLVHECVHVWQYQNHGNRYMADALGAQAIFGRGSVHDAYNWSDELARGNTKWEDMNAEAQAELIADIWTDGILTIGSVVNSNNGAFYEKQDYEASHGAGVCFETFVANLDGINHTDLAIASVKILRGHINSRLSHFI